MDRMSGAFIGPFGVFGARRRAEHPSRDRPVGTAPAGSHAARAAAASVLAVGVDDRPAVENHPNPRRRRTKIAGIASPDADRPRSGARSDPKLHPGHPAADHRYADAGSAAKAPRPDGPTRRTAPAYPATRPYGPDNSHDRSHVR